MAAISTSNGGRSECVSFFGNFIKGQDHNKKFVQIEAPQVPFYPCGLLLGKHIMQSKRLVGKPAS